MSQLTFDESKYKDPIDDLDEYIQIHLPKKYLNFVSDELIERAYDDCFELRAAGGIR